jgi:ribosomal protein L16 Arg81 hydroxylase
MAFCHRLAGDLRAYVQANIYLTPPHSRAVPPHSDAHHIFVLQISGAKTWRLYRRTADVSLMDPAVAGDGCGEDFAELEPTQSLILRPGDLLYVPHGLVHAAATSETASLHVTLGVHAGNGFQLLEELASLARTDPFFRGPLPHGLSSDQERSAWLSAFTQRLQELLTVTDPDGLLQRRQAAMIASQPVPRPGRLLDLSGVEQLTLETQVARRIEVDYQLTREPASLRLRFARQELTLPLFLAPALEALLQGRPLAVGAIGGLLTPSGRLELARQLVRDGLLKIVAPQ